ncbi:MAG TPA: nickel/cobalt transporter [Candidatus Lokiarchaeia archaeon]|nr:nickel/cobalt transporter [Candidatus Lokiarchaeia archaeon]
MVLYTAYLGVLAIGLLHGLEPDHGWPIAFFYSIRKEKPFVAGLVSSGILAVFHFLSSILTMLVYLLLKSYFNVPTLILNLIAAGILIMLGIMFWREKVEDLEVTQHGHVHGNKQPLVHEHEHIHPGQEGTHTHVHEHRKSPPLTLPGLAIYAFVLGFAHEEGFALLALAIGGVDPWAMMVIYSVAVTASMIGITLLCVKAFEWLSIHLQKISHWIPKICAVMLFALAAVILLNL